MNIAIRALVCLLAVSIGSVTLAAPIKKYSCNTPVALNSTGSVYSKVIVPTPGKIRETEVGILVDATTDAPYAMQLIYGTSPLYLGEFKNDVYMRLDQDAPQACADVCKNGCGSLEKGPQACKPPVGFDFYQQVNPAYHPWLLQVKGGEGALTEWLLHVDMETGGVSPTEKKWGGIAVGVSYLILTLAYVIMLIQGFRHRSYGMPLVGQAAMLGVTILVVGPGPMLQPCLFDVFIRVPTNFEPGTLANITAFMSGSTFAVWVWRIGLVIQGLVFLQYLMWGRSHTDLTEAKRKHFYAIAFGVLALFTIIEYLYIVFYQDYYVNEVYLVATAIMAVSYLVALFTKTQLRGFSVSVAWCWAIGTLLLYTGIVIGHMNEAFHDHLDTGFGYIHALYAIAVATFVIYAIGLTRRFRSTKPGLLRPSA